MHRWKIKFALLLCMATLHTNASTHAQQYPYSVMPAASQSMLDPAPRENSPEPHVASVPPGYPSGWPGSTTPSNSAIGRGSSMMQPGYGTPQYEAVPQGQVFGSPPLFAPGNPSAVVTDDGVIIYEAGEAPVAPPSTNGKDGVMQAISVLGTFLPDLSGDGLQIVDFDSYITLGFPFPTRESPLLVSPAFSMHSLSGPPSPDMPAALYDSYLQFDWVRPISDWIKMYSSVSPGWYSDWQTNSTQALRAPAKTVIILDWTKQTQFSFGIAYLDRDDLKFFPVGGVIWKPNDYFRVEAVIPRPRILVRTRQSAKSEDWFSIAGEFGGGQWAVEGPGGVEDILISRDYRIILGMERKSLVGAWGSRLEVGYVFGRTYDFRVSNTPDYEPDSTLLVRAGIFW